MGTSDLRVEVLHGVDLGTRYALKTYNEGIFERLKYLISEEMEREIHITAITPSDFVVGVLGLQQAPGQRDTLWLKHVSVDPDFQNRGIARLLFSHAVDFALSREQVLELNSLSEKGRLYLPRILADVQREHPGLLTRVPDDLIVEPAECAEPIPSHTPGM